MFAQLMMLGASSPYPASSTAFGYTGAGQTYVVPAGVTQIRIKSWGAGAQGANFTNLPSGGAGGYAFALVSVTPGETLDVIVGQDGTQSPTTGGATYGDGGTRTVNGSAAGGNGTNGGGGGGTSNSALASSGGGASGVKRSSTWLCRGGGGGGGGAGSDSANHAGEGGGSDSGTGGIFDASNPQGKGGASIGDTTTNGQAGQSGAAAAAGNNTDTDYANNAGRGGNGGTAANPGRVVIY